MYRIPGKMLLFLLFLTNQLVFGQLPQKIESEILRFANLTINKKAKISFKVFDLTNSLTLAQYQQDSSIVSASTTKLFSTYTALHMLGSSYKMTTRIYTDGDVNEQGELMGNVWIRGGGDVTLGSRYFNKEDQELLFLDNWVNKLKSAGVKSISGAVISDGSAFGYKGVPDGWSSDDTGNYYGAHAQGVNFLDNTVFVNFSTGKVGQKTKISSTFPEIKELIFENQVIAANISRDNAYLFGAPYEYQRVAKGSLPANRENFVVKGSMPDPEKTLALEFEKKLIAAGITVKQGALSVRENWFLEKTNYKDLTLLTQTDGASIGEIIQWTNHKSINLFAEGLLNILGYAANGDGSNQHGLEQIGKFTEQFITSEGLTLYDGSGLSEKNRISANHFIDLLTFIYKSEHFEEFFNSLPIAGESGTIKWLCEKGSGKGRIHAKSGTLKKVKSYAGYVDSKSGKRLAFAFTVNDFSCANYEIVKYMEPVLNAMAEY